jgi:hypothetical protein
MPFPTVNPPMLSPSLNEYDLPTALDPASGYEVSLLGVVFPDANGNTTLPQGAGLVQPQPNSQVTGKRRLPQVGPNKIPTVGLVTLDPTTGAIKPFAASSAATVSGKFQSTVLTGTGAAQSIPHGLGSTPSLVHVSAYDNTASGSTPFTFQISEGTHTSTNLLVTATSGLKYKVIAFA